MSFIKAGLVRCLTTGWTDRPNTHTQIYTDTTRMTQCSRGFVSLPQEYLQLFCVCLLIDDLNLRMRWLRNHYSCGVGGFSHNKLHHSLTLVSACLIVAKEPHPHFNWWFLCSLSRQQELFHVLAAYSVYNTVSLFVCVYRCVCCVIWRSVMYTGTKAVFQWRNS